MGNSCKLDKNNSLLNIFICNSSGQISKVKFIELQLPENIDYDLYNHKFYGWTFFEYENGLNKNNLIKIRKKSWDLAKSGKFQNVILCFVPNSLDFKDDLEILKFFAEKPDKKEKVSSDYYQPLLLFVSYSKEKNTNYYRKKLRELTQNDNEKYKMNELNITSFLYNKSQFTNELINELWKMTIYYNQLYSPILPMTETDDHLEIRFEQNVVTFNILLCGHSGAGKSSFVNIIKDRKTAYVCDSGINKSNKINEYIISFKGKIPLSQNNSNNFNNIKNYKEIFCTYKLIDTCGFSLDNKEGKELLNFIKNYQRDSNLNKDKIQCILYFIKDIVRFLSTKVEEEFFNFFYKEKTKIFFVINFCTKKNGEKKDSLITILNQKLKPEIYNYLVEQDESNIFEINLMERDGIKPFGLDELMKKLEKFFRPKQINIKELEKLNYKISETPMGKNNKNNKNEIFEEGLKIMKKSDYFSDITNIDDLYKHCIANSKKLVWYSFPILAGISFIPVPGVDDVVSLTIESGLILSIGKCFGLNMTKEEIKKSFTKINFGSLYRVSILISKVILRSGGVVVDLLKLLPPIGTIIAGAISCGVNLSSVKLTGNQAISYFLEKVTNEKNYLYLINISQNFNDNIEGLSLLKNRFENQE